jgi:hypothetical protein
VPSVASLVNLDAIRRATLVRDPFDFFIAHDVVSADALDVLSSDFPAVTGTGSVPVATLKFGPSFARLLEDLRSPAFSDAVGQQLGVTTLGGMPQLITYRGRTGARDGFVHTDADWKLVTVLLYLNPPWDTSGGRLRLLRSDNLDDVAAEVPPDCGTLVAFRRSARSFHGHKPHYGERRVVQINWVTDPSHVIREERRHRRSALLKSIFNWPRS